MKNIFKTLMLFALILQAGCFQVYNNNDDLRTVPTTNNPNVIPNHPTSFMPSTH